MEIGIIVGAVLVLVLVAWSSSAVTTYRQGQKSLEHRLVNQRKLLDTITEEQKASAKKAEDRLTAMEEQGKAESQRIRDGVIQVLNQIAQQQQQQAQQQVAPKK